MRNHLGSYECKLCLTLHTNEGSYLVHTQAKKHQDNLYVIPLPFVFFHIRSTVRDVQRSGDHILAPIRTRKMANQLS